MLWPTSVNRDQEHVVIWNSINLLLWRRPLQWLCFFVWSDIVGLLKCRLSSSWHQRGPLFSSSMIWRSFGLRPKSSMAGICFPECAVLHIILGQLTKIYPKSRAYHWISYSELNSEVSFKNLGCHNLVQTKKSVLIIHELNLLDKKDKLSWRIWFIFAQVVWLCRLYTKIGTRNMRKNLSSFFPGLVLD